MAEPPGILYFIDVKKFLRIHITFSFNILLASLSLYWLYMSFGAWPNCSVFCTKTPIHFQRQASLTAFRGSWNSDKDGLIKVSVG